MTFLCDSILFLLRGMSWQFLLAFSVIDNCFDFKAFGFYFTFSSPFFFFLFFFACWMSKYLIFQVCFAFMPFSSCVCLIAFSWMCTVSYVSNTFSSEGCLCFCQRTVICLLHLRMPVFTRLQVCVITFQSEHGMIHSRWLPSFGASWRKLKLRVVDKIEKGGKN